MPKPHSLSGSMKLPSPHSFHASMMARLVRPSMYDRAVRHCCANFSGVLPVITGAASPALGRLSQFEPMESM